MKKWPDCDIKVEHVKDTDMYKAIVKSRLPCGATQLEIAEDANANSARSKAAVGCVSKGRRHIITHKCNE